MADLQDQPEEHTKIKENHLNICRRLYIHTLYANVYMYRCMCICRVYMYMLMLQSQGTQAPKTGVSEASQVDNRHRETRAHPFCS